ncbi:cytochrome b5-like [Battus philenor]|uniref:cytochrome b5-like n=1 Tax=Battus philenor TaxID=42288 RepID=UPI0035CF4F4B
MATKKFTRKEIAERNSRADAVFIVDNLVYDVTKFLDDHPGGHEVLINAAGKDATEEFVDVGHSLDARDMMKQFHIGELVDEEKTATSRRGVDWNTGEQAPAAPAGSFMSSWKFPVVLGLLMTVLYTYLFG